MNQGLLPAGSQGIFSIAISDKMVYSSKRENAYQYSSQFQWDGTGKELEQFTDMLS